MPTMNKAPLFAEGNALVAAERLSRDKARNEATGEAAFVDSADMMVEKDETKESAVRQRRVWVRVTRLCNQRCTFCLDSWNQNGTYVPYAELTAFVRRGRELGGERLILSGGEASVHPEFIRLIRYGKEAGYDWIQTVTNGQMFAYPEFARRAKLAGLNEATFSMHGHNAKLHDALVGLPGAFERANQGIRNLQALGGVVVNVDIVINRSNAKHLREILDFYLEMGIREFDLLYIVPFGRGFEEFRSSLFFDANEFHSDFQRAFEVSKQPGVFLWTNRFPVAHLEGYEHLIQDPHKLHSEVNGGRHNFDGFLQTGTKPDCHGERCDHCFLEGLCRNTMFAYRRMLLARTFPRLGVDLNMPQPSPEATRVFFAQQAQSLELSGGTLEQRLQWLARERPNIGGLELELEVRSAHEVQVASASPEVDVLRVSSPEALDALSSGSQPTKPAVVALSQQIALRLLDQLARGEAPSQIKARLVNHEYLSESRAADPSPEQLRALAEAGILLQNVPPCIAGAQSAPPLRHMLDLHALDSRGNLDTDAYVHRYITGEYYAKSLRCRSCVFDRECPGMHINYLRNFGFAALQPVPAALPNQIQEA